jgi:transposase InsO family protein
LARRVFGFPAASPEPCYGKRVTKAPSQVRGARKPDWVVKHIVRLKALMPDAGCRAIADLFNRRFEAAAGMRVSKSFVAYTLRRERYTIAQCRKAIRRRQAKAGRRNLVWGLDLTGKQDDGGTTHAILGLIDHGTRRLLRLSCLAPASSRTVLWHLLLAIARYGKPVAIRTDNGSVFTARLFRTALRIAGIRHQRSDAGCPWQNGRIERLFGTLKDKLDRWAVPDGQRLEQSLRVFLFWYNAIRPHQNLRGRTPLEQWRGVDPFIRPPRQVARFSAWDGLLAGYCLRH